MNTDITYKIKPAGRHILTIGKDLIHDNYAAVVELVKNAYDADSPDVEIEFAALPDRSKYSIVVTDHGHGMSRDDVINKWLVPSTSDKVDRRKSRSGRIMQGNKGVGRYATSILGKDLLLETITPEGEKTVVLLEWDQFQKAHYLDDVDILVETTQVSEPQGTRLTVTGDKEFLSAWKKKQFEKLQDEFKKLKSPVSSVFGNDEFCIRLSVKGFDGVDDIKQVVEPYPFFDIFDYRIAGNISENGKGILKYSSQKAQNIPDEEIRFDVREQIPNSLKKELQFDFENTTGCGKFDIDIRVYDREPEAIESLINRGLKNESGDYVKKLDARRLLNEYNGIGVYRNGFRIRPLGETDFDWLRLNERRVQNPSLRIGSNQVIGYVQIQSEDQSDLIEKSARDGLKENPAFSRLKEITKIVIAELETRRFDYRDKTGLSRTTTIVEQDVQQLLSFDSMKRSIQTKLTKSNIDETTTDEIIEIINKGEKKKNKVVKEILQTIAIYQGQATLGQIINVILHESGQPLNCFKNDVPNLRYWYELFLKTGDLEKLKELVPIIDGIEESAETLVELFDKLNPLTAKKSSRKKWLELKKAIQKSLDLFTGDMKKHEVSKIVTGSDKFKLYCWGRDISAIFTNLIDNSMYWMREKDVPNKEISIDLVTDGNILRYVDYRDTGPGIEQKHSKKIFQPYFSTKPDGMGLGLAIAGEAAKRNGLELRACKSERGAHFRLQPKKGNRK